eukprot:gnl/MRDRNA2_/MRDRNA2_87827_c0_seq1.p1 gnl/MRDRNA2_/MRDRNA2_87827_c0~~gnl/MRDRNA2_/MRDRNA2_87827_c0_seq1.p1  ORF type:complete len:354 (+),score=69.24 gnl/MRDRNA2_/MRDRNA2_87827_c0_seq1:96-1157(+)
MSQTNINANCYYEVLGVPKTATDVEIQKAYKRLALKYHPDKNPNNKEEAEENFKKVSKAYDTLRDPEKRKVYDQFGHDGPPMGNPQEGNFGGMPGNFSRGTFNTSSMSREEADAIFRMFFGGGDGFSMFPGSAMGMPGRSNRVVFCSGMPGAHGGASSDEDDPMGMQFPGMNGINGMFPGMSHRQHQRGGQQPSYVIPKQAAVKIHGLTGAPEHNGKSGIVASWDASRSRYEVMVEGKSLSVKPQNLTQICEAEIHGLGNRQDLNGQAGEILGYDEQSDRYVVKLRTHGVAMKLRPANCILEQGTCVKLQGLSTPQFNGQLARITSIDRAAERYVVQCQEGKQIKIKYDNVLC